MTVNADNDTVDYDPNGAFESLAEGETATDTFTYTVTDGNGGTSTETVTVTVTGANDAPTANPDTADVGEDDTTPTTIDLTANDTDPDGTDDLEILTIDTTGTTGSVTVNPDNDSVDYDPNGAFEELGVGESATDTFTYTVTDGNGGTDTATITVTVTGANDDPDAFDDLVNVSADGTQSVVVTSNDTDPDQNDDVEILSVDTTNVQGIVTVDADNDTITYDPNGAFDSLGQGDTATETFTYTVTDGNGGQDTATVTVTVGGVNDAPTAQDDAATIGQGDILDFDVLANDTDPNMDTLSVGDVALQDPSVGSVFGEPGRHGELHAEQRLLRHRRDRLHHHGWPRRNRHGDADGDGDRKYRAFRAGTGVFRGSGKPGACGEPVRVRS